MAKKVNQKKLAPKKVNQKKLTLAIVSSRDPQEHRLPLSLDLLSRLEKLNLSIVVEKLKDADRLASLGVPDDYLKKNNIALKGFTDAVSAADIVLTVSSPQLADVVHFKRGQILVANLNAREPDQTVIDALNARGVTLFSLDCAPRITRAQAMDVLSSQANLAGYRAVLEASAAFGRALPMMTTAAGTIKPAVVLVMGAGVAGLQAIATAKRLGAIVLATDVRPDTKEQVESLGGKFVAVEDEEFKKALGNVYAKEMSEGYKRKQAALMSETISTCDIVITTALIPGRAAPILISKAAVKNMKPGSVIFDMAAANGGNCEESSPGKTITKNGVTIMAPLYPTDGISATASQMLAGNYWNFLSLILTAEDDLPAEISIDTKDEIVKGTLIATGGKKVHDMYRKKSPAKSKAKAKPKAKPKPKAKAKSPAKGKTKSAPKSPAQISPTAPAPASIPAPASPTAPAPTSTKTPAPESSPPSSPSPTSPTSPQQASDSGGFMGEDKTKNTDR